ncbi:MAG: hypothetical protein AB8B78_13585 [Polaribacter sp.]
METRNYECQYCKKEYVPKRRRVQKFCSNSCRVGSHQLKNKKLNKELVEKENRSKFDKVKINQMSFSGVGNSVAGTLAVEAIKSPLIREENKPATKGDLKQFLIKQEQFQEIVNMKKDDFGRKPFYDTKSKSIVYK